MAGEENPLKPPDGFQIVETVMGTYFYHLALGDASAVEALCGARTMHTQLPLEYWGERSHVNERYCAECLRLAHEIKEQGT